MRSFICNVASHVRASLTRSLRGNAASMPRGSLDSPSPSSPFDALKQQISQVWKESLESGEEDLDPEFQDAHMQALTAALRKLPVSLFPRVPKVVEVLSSASLADAISILEQHNFRCLPVRSADKADSADWKERYLGIIDYPGIMLWVFSALGGGPETVAEVTDHPTPPLLGLAASTAEAMYGQFMEASMPYRQTAEHPAPAAAEREGARFRDEILSNMVFKDMKVGDVITCFPGFTPFTAVEEIESVLSVMQRMAHGGARLVPVVSAEGDELLTVITPMGVLDFLCQCSGLPWFDTIAQKPISALGLPFNKPDGIIKVEEGDLLMEPFRLMLEHRISGTPVVAPMPGNPGYFEVVANISSTDMVHLLHCPLLFEGLKDPRRLVVSDFLEAAENDALRSGARERLGPTMKPPMSCGGEETLLRVMLTMRRGRIRRVYVKDGDGSMLGIVTLRDVISLFGSPVDLARPVDVLAAAA